jgi:hypothetical protein
MKLFYTRHPQPGFSHTMAGRFVWLMTYMFISITSAFINRLNRAVKVRSDNLSIH